MNIILVNHYAGSPTYGMEFRPHELSKHWASIGNTVTVYGSIFSHLRKQQPSVISEKTDGVNYRWLLGNSYSGNGMGRILNILFFIIQLLFLSPYIAFTKKPDVVISSSTYTFDIIPCWLIAKMSRAKLVFEIHDLWPMSLYEIGGMSKYHPFALAVQLCEYLSYKLSNKVISILPNTYPHAKKFGIQKHNFDVIENGITPVKSVKLPKTHQTEINSLKKQGKFLIGYAGAHSLANALEYFIDAAQTLKDKNIHFVLIGGGQGKESLIKHATSQNTDNITFLDRVDKSAIPTFLEQMDVLYIGALKKDIYKYGVSPNKIFDYMLSKRPIISSINAGNDIIAAANCGITIMGENSKEISKAILKMKSMTRTNLTKLGTNGCEYVKNNHSYKLLSKRFLQNIGGK